MKYFRPFSDKRLTGCCAYCGEPSQTRDHAPPLVFLDAPYPENLPVVECCGDCNQGASLDEEYVACMIEAAVCGTADPALVKRRKIARILKKKPKLASLITESIVGDGVTITVIPNHERLARVFTKIARGLMTFETADISDDAPFLRYATIGDLDQETHDRYLQLTAPELLPEVGSRMMQRVLVSEEEHVFNSWEVLQPGQFAYAVELFGSVTRVKFLVADFIAVESELTAAT